MPLAKNVLAKKILMTIAVIQLVLLVGTVLYFYDLQQNVDAFVNSRQFHGR